jgi:GH24 family phage-related lysozyme (muramidase)
MPPRTPQPPKRNYPATAALRPNDPNSPQSPSWGLPAGQGQPPDQQSFLQDYAKRHVGFDHDPQSGQLGRYQAQSPSAQLRGEQPRFQPMGAGYAQWLREKELGEPSTTRPMIDPNLAVRRPQGPVPASGASDQLRKGYRKIMEEDEGNRHDAYYDTRNVLTVGIGHKVGPEDHLKRGDVIDDQQIERLYAHDSQKALGAALAQAQEAGISDPAFIARLASVNYQLGTGWNAEHKKTWALIKAGDYEGAVQEAARSDWYKQTPNRVMSFQEALRALPSKRDH